MSKRVLITLAAALLAVCACQPRLVILHTNDTHSHFEPVRSGAEAGLGGVIERAAFVDSIRTVYGPDKVLFLHAGDFGQGTSYFTELKGRLEPAMIDALGYDCVALGNHEFDNGIEDLTERLKMIKNGTGRVCQALRHPGACQTQDRGHRARGRPVHQCQPDNLFAYATARRRGADQPLGGLSARCREVRHDHPPVPHGL